MRAVAEAPGKVIIAGEHFVVHGAWALAAALERRVRVAASDSDGLAVISDVFPVRSPKLAPIRDVVAVMSREYTFKPNIRLHISSELPQGSGLGSSAATMVGVVSAVARLRGIRLSTKETIKLSMIGEKVTHGRPSGIDPTVCTMGGAVLFRPGDSPLRVSLGGARTLLVAYSGRSRSTKRQVSRVSSVKKSFPGLFDGLTESISEVSRMAAERLTAGDQKGLGKLLTFNQAVLATIGVSTPETDRLVQAFLSQGCYGAKLTGAGGGGCVLAVGPKGKEKRITSSLRARGIETFQTSVPAAGVRSWLER